MRYEGTCEKCGSPIKVRMLRKYLGQDSEGYTIPISRFTIGRCKKCDGQAYDEGYKSCLNRRRKG